MEEKENEPSSVFSFKKWLIQQNLTSVEHIFRENNMISMDSLSMSNAQLSKLLSDKRVCSNAKLVAMIITSLQSVDSDRSKSKADPEKPAQTKNNVHPSHDNIVLEMENKLGELDQMGNRLISLREYYEKQKLLQSQYLTKSKTKYLNDLNKSRNEILHVFDTIFGALKRKEHSLLSELDQFQMELRGTMDAHHEYDDEKESHTVDDKQLHIDALFDDKYRTNEQIVSDCKRCITQQIHIINILNTKNDATQQIREIAKNMKEMYVAHMNRFNENEEYMKEQTDCLEANKYDIQSVVFKLNEDAYGNVIKDVDAMGEMLRYKKIEIEIKNVEWSDVSHINIDFEFINVDAKYLHTVHVQQYEIQYRYLDYEVVDIDKFEWKTIVVGAPCKSSLNIEIDNLDTMKGYISSDNDTWIFVKMKVKHNPYWLWSGYSSVFKRKIANFLIVERNQTVRLKWMQKKKKPSYHKEKYTNSSSNLHSLRSASSDEDEEPPSSNSQRMSHQYNQYYQYYAFDGIVIQENGILSMCIDHAETQADHATKTDHENGTTDQTDIESMHPRGYLHLVIQRDLVVHKGGRITVCGLGYAGGTRYESGDSANSFGALGQTENNKGGGGGSKTYELGCGGGGGYGTPGEDGCSGKGFGFISGTNKTKYREGIDGRGGSAYGDDTLSVVHYGSGGGGGDYGDSKGGNGGGIIIIDCQKDIIMEEHSALQANGHCGKYDSDGSGSGGSIFIHCKSLSMNQTAKIEACGGKNNLKGHGGNGGDGRIRIKCETKDIACNKLDITPRPHIG
eukprot:188115_1